MNAITLKVVQIHFECVCGRNTVYTDYFNVPWKDFYKYGIQRKIDRSTGKPFLLRIDKSFKCSCYE